MKPFLLLAVVVTYPAFSFAHLLPLASSVMDVTESRYDFETVKSAVLTLSSENPQGPSHIIIDYGSLPVLLAITDTSYDEDGCAVFTAELADQEPLHGPRFHINLESDYGCEGLKPWKASVRAGYGWCGTMDSTMDLVGIPEWNTDNSN